MTTDREMLRQVPLFAGLSEEDFERLYEMAQPVTVAAGETLIREGDVGDSMYAILDGEFEVIQGSGQQELILGRRGSGEVIGEMALVQRAPRNATVRALRESRLLKISQLTFQILLDCGPTTVLSILQTIMTRLRQQELLLMQQQKMAALGTMAAGLAHELNNPAAAVQRGADQLREALANWERATAELAALGLDPARSAKLEALRAELARRAASPPRLDPLDRSDQEDALQTWLEERGVAGAWELAPALVGAGWDDEDMADLAGDFADNQLAVVACWLGAGSAVYTLLDEIGRSAAGISQIVKAVKNYSYLDQSPVQSVDVHEGLENTLVILRHKLKQGVAVRREYAPDLPKIEAYASELNQVWTNLIDNAIDAMSGRGELVLRTSSRGDHVVVEITDSGPGIPPEVRARLFELFYTTKPQGQGTGLGLHIVYNIVVQRHHGQVTVDSRPGETTFRVALPVRLARVAG